MNNLNELLNLINSEYVICGDNLKVDDLNIDFKTIKDVRSAAFYAFGKSKATNENVVLLINGDYLPNTYTVLTEAWFQKTNLIIIALYNSIYDVETNYLDRCTVCNITFIDKDFEQFKERVKSSLNLIGPKLLNIVVEKKANKTEYNDVLSKLKNHLQSQDTVFLYNSTDVELPCAVKNVEEKYKYGTVSKYLGYINAKKKSKQILVCSVECLEVDLNILNNRAMSKNFKAIIRGNIEHIREWVEKNNIRLITSTDVAKDIEELYNSEQAIILNLKED